MDDYGGDGCCLECCSEQEEEEELIHPYHCSEPDLVFHGDENTRLFFGVELETENYQDRGAAAEELYAQSQSEELFYLSEDCSLDNGIEIITQPCTLDFHLDKFPWGKIIDIVLSHGGKSESGKHAAMHIHLSKTFFRSSYPPKVTYDLYELRFAYLFEKFRTELLKFARTSSYLANRSAQPKELKSLRKEARETAQRSPLYYGKYQAVNLRHDETIEVRIFRGTLRTTDIKASLELVDFLAHLVTKTSNQTLQRLSWEGLVKMIDPARYTFLLPAISKYVTTGGQNIDSFN